MAKARSFSLSLSLLPREFLEIFVCIWHRRKAHGFLPPLFFLINLIALDFPRTRFNVFLFFLSLFFSVFFLLLVNFPPALQNFRSIQRKRGFVSFFSLSLSLSQFLTNRWLIHEKISPTCFFFFIYIYSSVSIRNAWKRLSVSARNERAKRFLLACWRAWNIPGATSDENFRDNPVSKQTSLDETIKRRISSGTSVACRVYYDHVATTSHTTSARVTAAGQKFRNWSFL